ncbi:glycosyltransferase family 4 protein [Chitinophaga eiseniae]|uniref:Glycosyltransferase family 4 protein n=1 Tax=Chitinophaga eiseniae TaxID=634771 RepID=A0A847S5S9_9BACT|nr:glycosyltransferase family 1 protein [Chitinophaga eiseniae]NLR78610.1 glycosyltransferase family 4 protein [Chitinophaga eiseniae]
MKLVIDCLIFEDKKAFGYQEYLFNLLDYFFAHYSKLKAETVIIACEKKSVVSFEKYASRFLITPFNVSSRWKLLVIQNQLAEQLQLHPDDVILSTYNYAAVFKKCKSVLVIHDLLFLRKHLLNNTLMRMQRKLLIPPSIRNADRIIAISNATANDVIQHYTKASGKVSVAYNYFNFRKFDGDIPEDLSAYPLDRPYFLSVSSILKHKNVVTLLKAYEIYATQGGLANLVLVGYYERMDADSKAYYDSLNEAVKEKIFLTGYISNQLLKYCYQHCECFILPTKFEGLGMPVVEAMYFNAPCVLSDLEVCREVSLGLAVYFNADDYKGLAEILTSKTYKSREGVDFRQSIQQKFSELQTSEKYIEVLNTI